MDPIGLAMGRQHATQRVASTTGAWKMGLPVVAIVGRPNVGKSSLFNVLARKRASIVDPMAGVTRDRVSSICDLDDFFFELIDTGGHGIVDRDDLNDHVERQIRCAVDLASLIIFVVDAREGLTELDRSTAELLRRRPHSASVLLVANKVDSPRAEPVMGEFAKLGVGEPMFFSAVHGVGWGDLRDAIVTLLKDADNSPPVDPMMSIALVGRRNAGKSTFVNALAGEERVIVSEVPGTTRDSIDVRFELDGDCFLAIDTAGVKKRAKLVDNIEYYAFTRASSSIRRADVVLMLIDATEPVSQVDKKLARYIADEFKPCVLVVNKWDLAKNRATTDDYGEYLTKILPEVRYAPVVFTSANTGKNTISAVEVARSLYNQSRIRVGTGRLNQVLRDAVSSGGPKPRQGRKAPRLYYATQVSTGPPTVLIFVNAPDRLNESYRRFLLNRFRESLPFEEVPIRLVFRARREGAVRRTV